MKIIYGIYLLVLAAVVQADDESECLDFHVIKNAPLGFINTDNESTGVHWEYLTALEKETGFCINKTLLPYARVWQSMEQGDHDGGIMFKSESRSNFVNYAGFVRTVNVVVIPVNSLKIENYNDLYSLTIGKTRGTHLSQKFDADANINIVELNNYAMAAQMIKFGRINAIAGSALVLSYQLAKYDALDSVSHINKLILGKKEQWLQLSKNSKHLAKIPVLNKAINKLRRNGTFDVIMNKYYGIQWQAINREDIPE